MQDGKAFFQWQDQKNLFETAWRLDGKMVAAAMEGHNIAVIDTSKISIPEGRRALTGSTFVLT